jgi:Protein of unknown function (DUF2933)
MNVQEQPQRSKWYQSRLTWILLGFIAIGGSFLLTQHTAHVLGLLPYALLFLCPLMMFFMMRGGHGEHDGQPPGRGEQ